MERVRAFSRNFRRESLSLKGLSLSKSDSNASLPSVSEGTVEEPDQGPSEEELLKQLEEQNKKILEEENRLREDRLKKKKEQAAVVAEIMESLQGTEEIPFNENRVHIITCDFFKRQKNLKRLISHKVYLFSDVLLICKQPDAKGVLRVGKIIDPKILTVETLASPDNLPNQLSIEITLPERSHELVTENAEEGKEFLKALVGVSLRLRYDEQALQSSDLLEGTYGLEHTVRVRTLHAAAMGDNVISLMEILNGGASVVGDGYDVNAADANGATPLHLAAWRGNVDIAELLIEHGAETVPDAKKRTPAHMAVIGGHVGILELLERHGHPVCDEDEKRRTPLHYAILTKQRECLPPLMKPAAMRCKDADGYTPLHLGFVLGTNDTLLGMLIDMMESGADARSQTHVHDLTQRTPLHTAAAMDDYDGTRLLVKAGVHVNQRDVQGYPPLLLATSGAVMTFLVSAGARIADLTPELTSLLERQPAGLVEALRKEESRAANRKEQQYDIPMLKGPLGRAIPFLSDQRYMDDSEAEACTICEAVFSPTFRRHHCRNCGALVCSRCISHKFTLSTTVTKEGVKPVSGKPAPLATCDGCFNFLYFNDPVILSPDPDVDEKIRNRAKEPQATAEREREELFDGYRAGSDARQEAADDFDRCLREADQERTVKIMEDNKRKVMENAQKLRDASQKAEEMQREANEFAENCRKIAEKSGGGNKRRTIFF